MNGFAEVAFVQRARPKTQAGAPPSGIVENVPCNGFAFPAGVGRDYDFSGLFNQPGNDVELGGFVAGRFRSEEHTSELQSLMRNSYAVFCLKKKKYAKLTITLISETEKQPSNINIKPPQLFVHIISV